MTILELSGFFVAIKRVCSRLFAAYRGNIVGRHCLFDSPRRPEAADRICRRNRFWLPDIGFKPSHCLFVCAGTYSPAISFHGLYHKLTCLTDVGALGCGEPLPLGDYSLTGIFL
jgi:hypothetical protein